MNIAFQAIILFFLLLPGLLLRSTYNGRISKETVLPQNYTPFTREAIRVVFISLLLQLLWIGLFNLIGIRFGIEVDLYSVFFLLTGHYQDIKTLNNAILSVTNYPIQIILYFATLYIASYYTGYNLHKTIRKKGWDKKYLFWRFNNEWHYLLSGEVLQFPEMKEPEREVDLVFISAVAEVGSITYLYVGIVKDWYLDSKGNLDRLILNVVYRRKLSADRDNNQDRVGYSKDSRYYRIEGDYFLLNCENTKNISIEYVSITDKTQPKDSGNFDRKKTGSYDFT